MSIVMALSNRATEAAGGRRAEPLARLTTTLYALIATLQEVVGPEDDALVVATVVHLLQSGRLTGLKGANTPDRRDVSCSSTPR
jgi:hypothetical protein